MRDLFLVKVVELIYSFHSILDTPFTSSGDKDGTRLLS